jgi:hypothetical protein
MIQRSCTLPCNLNPERVCLWKNSPLPFTAVYHTQMVTHHVHTQSQLFSSHLLLGLTHDPRVYVCMYVCVCVCVHSLHQ